MFSFSVIEKKLSGEIMSEDNNFLCPCKTIVIVSLISALMFVSCSAISRRAQTSMYREYQKTLRTELKEGCASKEGCTKNVPADSFYEKRKGE